LAYLDEVQIDRELLLEFFLRFSRVEFALKASGFALGDVEGVRPNWNGFAISLRGKFHKTANPELLQVCDFVLNDPPRRQVLVDGRLAWNTQAQAVGEADVEFLIKMVRSVRNNLFHGGKYNIALHEDTARSEALLRNCLIILEECVDLSPVVKQAFEEAKI